MPADKNDGKRGKRWSNGSPLFLGLFPTVPRRTRKFPIKSIWETAWEIILTEGWQSFSIRKVADAIEYSVPVIYSHFENKDAILLEFSKKGFELLAESLAGAKQGNAEPAAQIRAMGQAYWDFAFSNKEYYQLMFGLGIPTCDTASRIPALATFNQVIMESLIAAAGPGIKQDFDPWLKYQSFWSMLHGLVSINMVAPERAVKPGGSADHDHPTLPQKVLDDVLCSFIRGIEAPWRSPTVRDPVDHQPELTGKDKTDRQ